MPLVPGLVPGLLLTRVGAETACQVILPTLGHVPRNLEDKMAVCIGRAARKPNTCMAENGNIYGKEPGARMDACATIYVEESNPCIMAPSSSRYIYVEECAACTAACNKKYVKE